ncbi:hypothetical protein [Terrisporobacter petrolearius]|uniref:hypothetical protein n=1 Tax=Terrisporobacter petrolearius TaxID=1460447 RepID=UPI0031CCB0F1
MGNIKDLTGSKIGMLNIIERKRENNRTYYLCKCECGNKKWIRSDYLKNMTHCGCKKIYHYRDITNEKFGMLTPIEVVGTSKNNGKIWRCRCDCGNVKDIYLSSLISGLVISCGCYKKEKAKLNIKKAFEVFKDNNVLEHTNIAYISLQKPIKSNKSGVTGVYFEQTQQKWGAVIRFKRKTYHLGFHKNKEDAIKAREEAEERLHKRFLKEKGIKK